MIPSKPFSLLRRTTMAAAAALVACMALPASAATVTLGGSSAGENCAYGSMAVDPAGNITVSCSAQASGGLIGTATTTPPPSNPAGTFAVAVPSTSLAAGTTSSSFTVTRTGGSTGSVNAVFTVTGGACVNAANISLYFADGSTTSIPAVVPLTITGAGTCTITLNSASPGTVGTPASQTITVASTSTTTGSGGTVPTVTGCPTPAAGTTMYKFPAVPGQRVDNNGYSNFVLPSGAIGAVQLPLTINGHSSGQVQLTYSAYTASTQTNVEISISKCPGVIDPTGSLTGAAPSCYFASFTSADATVDWMGKLVSGVSTVGKCMALESDGIPYYANIRYTYDPSGCVYGNGQGCGEQLQWNDRAP